MKPTRPHRRPTWPPPSPSTLGLPTAYPATRCHDVPGYDSGVLTMIIASFLLVAFSFRNASRLWKTFFQDLTVVRRRANLFDERTVGEKWVIAAMLIQTCVYEGLMLFAMLSVNGRWTPQDPVFPTIGRPYRTGGTALPVPERGLLHCGIRIHRPGRTHPVAARTQRLAGSDRLRARDPRARLPVSPRSLPESCYIVADCYTF